MILIELIFAIIIGITFGIIYMITILFFAAGIMNVKRLDEDIQEWMKDERE